VVRALARPSADHRRQGFLVFGIDLEERRKVAGTGEAAMMLELDRAPKQLVQHTHGYSHAGQLIATDCL
jgi:hypothetical protein